VAELDLDALRRLDGSLPWRADQDPVYRNGHYIRSSSGTLIATVSPDVRAHTADIVAIVNQLPVIIAALERGALEVDRLRDRLREKNEIIDAFAGPAGMTPEDVAHAVEQAAYWERTAAQIDEALGVKIDRIAGERDASRAAEARLRTMLRDLRDAHAAHEEAEADVLRALFDVEQSDEDDTDAYDAAVVAKDAAAERLGTAWAAAQRELDGEAGEGRCDP
jgi:hypothetical protein